MSIIEEHFVIEGDSDVIIARAAAARMAERVDFPHQSCREISIAVSELCTNIVKYACPGTVCLRVLPGSPTMFVVIAEDCGKGIRNIENAMTEHYTSDGPTVPREGYVRPLREGLGCGLSAVKRLMDSVSVHSEPRQGTRITATKILDRVKDRFTHAHTVKKLLILGMGNSIVSDDRIGLVIAEKIARLVDDPRIEVKMLEAGGLDVMEAMAGFDAAVVIDAIKTGTHEPGEIIHMTPEQFSSTPRGKAVHDVSFFDAVEFGKRMNLKMPCRIDIIAIEVVDNVTVGEKMSQPVMEAVEPSIERVLKLIGEHGIVIRTGTGSGR